MDGEIPLGKSVPVPVQYSPQLLFDVSRAAQRERLGLGAELPFRGVDIWNAWELSWLNPDGLPQCATAEIRVPADSPNIVESKSLKLYLNSFAMTHYATPADVLEMIEQDLSACTGSDVAVTPGDPDAGGTIARLPGHCVDTSQVRCDTYEVDPELLEADSTDIVSEQLYSHLLRSLCPVTGQPDFASVLVAYTGPRIDRESLLRYIVSYRQHEDFHENCVERMFVDIVGRCATQKLTVHARYTRRGGIDINPFRSNHESDAPNIRLLRQ